MLRHSHWLRIFEFILRETNLFHLRWYFLWAIPLSPSHYIRTHRSRLILFLLRKRGQILISKSCLIVNVNERHGNNENNDHANLQCPPYGSNYILNLHVFEPVIVNIFGRFNLKPHQSIPGVYIHFPPKIVRVNHRGMILIKDESFITIEVNRFKSHLDFLLPCLRNGRINRPSKGSEWFSWIRFVDLIVREINHEISHIQLFVYFFNWSARGSVLSLGFIIHIYQRINHFILTGSYLYNYRLIYPDIVVASQP